MTPDGDDGRVRLALALPEDDAAARAALAAVPRLGAVADVVVVAAPARAARLGVDAAAVLAAPGEVAAAAAGAGGRALLLAGGREEALGAARAGAVDAVLAAPAAGAARLHARQGARVVEPAPGRDVAALAAALVAARRALVGLGAPRPRLVAFEPDARGPVAEGRGPGAELLEPVRLAAALDAARGAGVDAVGPLPPGRAVLERHDALVAATRSQLELPLALLGTGATTVVDLGAARDDGPRVAWPDPLDAGGLVAAAERLAAWARAEGPLVAAREAEARRRPVVAVRAQAGAAAGHVEPRCPYCKRRLDEGAGDAGPPGPPIACAGCGTGLHRDCLAEHGRCTTLGCGATRGVRLGVSVPLAGLGPEAPARRPFLAADGGDAGGSALLRVEAPLDDPAARPPRRRLELELLTRRARRGELVQGFVTLHAPRPARVLGGVLRLRATLTTRPLVDAGGVGPRTTPILDRAAAFLGDAPGGALARLQDGVAALFGGGGGFEVPAGVRRWPVSFRVALDHPATVTNRGGGVEERVRTTLEAVLDGEAAEVELEVG